jgi:uncharacterized membrane protein
MVTEQFRRQLRQESEKWWTEGLIDAALYENLSQRYQFDRLERDASHRFIAILMGLGAVLLGIGAITFVAANWQVWSRTFKVLLLLACFVSINAAGFYLWRRPVAFGQQRLGHGLLILGALLLGANLGLMSQMFHQHGDLYELLLIWGLGVAAMAYSLRLTSLSVLSLILTGMGYHGGWLSWSSWQEFSGTQAIVQHFPLVVSVVFVPLAYWCRSRVIFGLSAVAIATALVLNLKPVSIWGSFLPSAGWIAAIAFILPPALLWGYSDRIWMRQGTADTRYPAISNTHAFHPVARSLAVWFLSIVFYVFAFRFWWDNAENSYLYFLREDLSWQPLIDAAVLAVVAGLGWLQLRYQLKRAFRLQAQAINSGTIAALLLLAAVVFLRHQTIGLFGAFSFNLLLFLLALGLIRDGLAVGQRHTFWGGMVLLVLSIITRMLEYNTGLLLKSIVFALCGVGVIAAGLWFERNVKPHRHTLPQASQEGTL